MRIIYKEERKEKMSNPQTQIYKSIIGTPIKINLNVNIENKPINIILTSSILYYPETKTDDKTDDKTKQEKQKELSTNEQYPLLPPVGVDYPINELIILPFKQMVKILFNPDKFTKKMSKWVSNLEQEPIPEEENKTMFFSEQTQRIIDWEKKNVQILLHLLFPTYFFGSIEYKTSMHYWNPKEKFHSFPIERTFSYLKYNGKIYTVTNCVWMNDILNNTYYKPFVDGFKFYYLWINSIQKILKKRIEQIKRSHEIDQATKSRNDIALTNINLLLDTLSEEKELNYMNLRPIYNKNNVLLEFTKKPIEYLDSLVNIPVVSDKNNSLNELFDIRNKYTYADINTTNYKLLYKILSNIYSFKERKKNLSELLYNLPDTKYSLNLYFYTGLTTFRSERYYKQNLFTEVVMDVIDGVVDESNKTMVKCYYYDHWIGKMMNFFNGSYWNVSKDRIYVDLKNLQNEEEASNDVGNGNNTGNHTGNETNGMDNLLNYNADNQLPLFKNNALNNEKDNAPNNKNTLAKLTDYFRISILNTTKVSDDKNEILKKLNPLLKQIQEKTKDVNFEVNLDINNLFEMIVTHKWTNQFIKTNPSKKNPFVNQITESEDFLKNSVSQIFDLRTKSQNIVDQKLLNEWEAQNFYIKTHISTLDITMNEILKNLGAPKDTDTKNIYDYKPNQTSSQEQQQYLNYLILFLYKNMFEILMDYIGKKTERLNLRMNGENRTTTTTTQKGGNALKQRKSDKKTRKIRPSML